MKNNISKLQLFKMGRNFASDIKNEFKGYTPDAFRKDALAGITVTAVALPLALAFGVSSGASAASGLITAIIAGVVIGIFSGASFQISGPTGAMTAILITLVAQYGLNGIFLACFMAGIILVIAGFLKLGRIISIIPSSVITGFTSGIAVIIAMGQLDNFLGVKSPDAHVITKVSTYFVTDFAPNWQSIGIGVFVIIIMIIWPKKWNAVIPSSLVVLAAVLIANNFLKLDVETVGNIPKTLFLNQRLDLSSVTMNELSGLFLPSVSIAALAMLESLLCGAVGSKLKGEKIDGDRELVAQGIGNILIPFFGGVPATAAIARTSVAIKSGGVTRMTGIIHAAGILLAMFVLSPVMSAIPLSALAGILIVTAWRMNDWDNIFYIFQNKFYSGMAKFFVTFFATIILDLTQAIIIGVVFSSFLIVMRIADIEINVSDIDKERLEEIGIELEGDPKGIRIAYLSGTIFFAVVEKLGNYMLSKPDTQVIILSMRGVPVIDISGVQALMDLNEELEEKGIKMMLTSVQPKVLNMLERGKLVKNIGEEYIFDSAEHAIVYAHEFYS